LLRLVEALLSHDAAQAKDVLRDLLAFPADLPDLAALRPPEENARPEGISESCFERRRRGQSKSAMKASLWRFPSMRPRRWRYNSPDQ